MADGRRARRAHGIACGVLVGGLFCVDAAAEPLSGGAVVARGENVEDPRAANQRADDRRAAALLTALSEEARDQKAAGGWSTIALGAAFVAAGVLVDSEYDAAYGPALWLGGVSAMAAGISTLLVRPPIQDFADEMGPAPVNLEAEWRARAEQAESERNTAVILDLGLGVGGATAATIFAAGAGDMPQSDRSKWVALTAMLGGAGFAGALYNILLESPIESGYRLAYPEPTTAAQPISVKVSTVRKGGALKLYGTF